MNKAAIKVAKKPIALSIATALLALSSLPASAETYEFDNFEVTFDSTFSFGTSFRIEDRKWDHVGNSNAPSLNWSGYDAIFNPLYASSQVWDAGQGYSTNGDNGNLNFDPGEAFSTQFIGLHELDIRSDNMGVFLRGMYFYDFTLMDEDRAWHNPTSGSRADVCMDPKAKEEACTDIRMLDAFFYADFDVGNVPVSVRIGDQVVSWGESALIPHGINTINPVDISRLRSPGAELKEAFIPVGMIWASLGLTDKLSAEFYYQYEWESNRLPVGGTYFATNDFAGEGGYLNNIQLGFSGNPDIDLEFLLTKLNEFGTMANGVQTQLATAGLSGAALAGQMASELGGAYLAYPTKVTLKPKGDMAHVKPDDNGQYGIKLSYYSPEFNETEFGLYYINYHSKMPLISGVTSNFTGAALAQDLMYLANTTITEDNVTDLAAFSRVAFEYPEDIKLYGLSWNTTLGTTAFSGEISWRKDEPLQIDDVELLYAAMPQQLANAGLRPDLAGISQLDNHLGYTVGPGGTASGAYLVDSMQAQFTLTHIFGPTLGTDNLVFLTEVGYSEIKDLPGYDELRMNGPGTGRSGRIPGKEGLHIGLSDGPETNPFPTSTAWGYRMIAKADFNNIMAGINMSTKLTFSHDVNGITPDPMFTFLEGRKSAGLTFSFDYQSKISADISYNSFFGGKGTTNGLEDRDFVSFVVKYSI